MNKLEIINNLSGETIKAVQLKDGTFITEKLAKEMEKSSPERLPTPSTNYGWGTDAWRHKA